MIQAVTFTGELGLDPGAVASTALVGAARSGCRDSFVQAYCHRELGPRWSGLLCGS